MTSCLRKIFIIACLLTLATACDRLPFGVMSKEQMVDFLSEAYLIESFYAIETNHNYDKLKPEIVNSYRELLKRQGLTERQFERSINYYMRHPEEYKEIHQQVVDRLDSQVPEKAEHRGPKAELEDLL
ncbi:MAG: DUF4296 domain-containing protein [Bacteroidales bacterium]|nr:DUF4296 domain-containing protein [Bacteroidales bacterium]